MPEGLELKQQQLQSLRALRDHAGSPNLTLAQAEKGIRLGMPVMSGYIRKDGSLAYVTVMDTVQRYAKPMQKKDEAAIRAYF